MKTDVISESAMAGTFRRTWHRRAWRKSRLAAGLLTAACLASAVGAAVMPALAGEQIRFTSPREAFQQGVAAYRAGQYEIAVPALEAAARGGEFMAPFFLARIYSGSHPAYLDHARAYRIFSEIVDKWGHAVDPGDYRRAPTVAKAMTEMGRYVARGLPEIGLKPDKAAALRLYQHAARFFNDHGAQFELAKLQLIGDGVSKDVNMALYWFQKLAHSGHPGAQAFLADLMWNGRYLARDPGQALALITLAMKNAPSHELWIGDIYQNIFCGASGTVRKDAKGFVAGWDEQLGTMARTLPADRIGGLEGPIRTCGNGEEIKPLQEADVPMASGRATELFMHGDTGGVGGGAIMPKPDARLPVISPTTTPREANAVVYGGNPTRPAGYELVKPVR